MFGLLYSLSNRKPKPDVQDMKSYNNKLNYVVDPFLTWRPLGLKVAALFSLGISWSDKVNDIWLLAEFWGHTWTGYVLFCILV